VGQCVSHVLRGSFHLPPAVFRAVTGRSKADDLNHIGGVYPHSSGVGECSVYVTGPRDAF
jgi:hypothetical protein